jgi:hypothetical protein
MNTRTLLANYCRYGVIFPLPALSDVEVRQAQYEYQQLCAPNKTVVEGEQRLFGHLLHPWIAQLVAHPKIIEAVRCLIGPNILVWVSEFNAKAPHTPNFFSWHQDLYYWRHQYDDLRNIPLLTTWLALNNTDESNGCLHVLPGSHTQLLAHEEKPCEHNMLTRAQEVCVSIDKSQVIPIKLAAGEFSIHHPLLCHTSGPNTSTETRIGLVTRYIAPEIAPPVRPAYAWLVSGEDSYGHWDHVAPSNIKTGPTLRLQCIQAVQNMTGARFK